jgi:cytochrome c oxidase assembly protein Cox11
MKNLSRLTVLVIVLAGLVLATGIAYAAVHKLHCRLTWHNGTSRIMAPAP